MLANLMREEGELVDIICRMKRHRRYLLGSFLSSILIMVPYYIGDLNRGSNLENYPFPGILNPEREEEEARMRLNPSLDSSILGFQTPPNFGWKRRSTALNLKP